MIGRLVLGSLRINVGRTALALAALVLGATLAAALLNLSGDLRGRIGTELRGYGANLIALPQQQSMDQALLSSIETLPSHASIADWSPALAGVIACGRQQAVMVGVDFTRLQRISPYLKVEGAWPTTPDQVAIGWRLAQALNVRKDAPLSLAGQAFKVSGLVESGGDEDHQLFVALPVAQHLLRQPARLTTIAFSVRGGQPAAERVAADIAAAWHGVTPRVVRQIAATEATFLDHVIALMAAIMVFVFIVAGMCVMMAMFTQVNERRKEIGLMKALGASNHRIALLFLTEAVVLGSLAGLIGFPLGIMLSRQLGTSLFGAAIDMHPSVFLAAIVLPALLSMAAQILPLRRAMSIAPAIALRGE